LFGAEQPVLERTPRVIEHAISRIDRAFVAGLHHGASSATLEIEHEFVGAGPAHEPGVAGIALRAAVEADELGVADLDELEVAADDGGAERLGLDVGE
jgi:hypothetical protein